MLFKFPGGSGLNLERLRAQLRRQHNQQRVGSAPPARPKLQPPALFHPQAQPRPRAPPYQALLGAPSSRLPQQARWPLPPQLLHVQRPGLRGQPPAHHGEQQQHQVQGGFRPELLYPRLLTAANARPPPPGPHLRSSASGTPAARAPGLATVRTPGPAPTAAQLREVSRLRATMGKYLTNCSK